MKKVLKKIVIYTLLMIITIVSASVIATFLYRDRLINHFIREANKSLNTPIHVEKISVSALTNFPQVALTFKGVVVEESFPGSSYPLLEAARIDFTFNPFRLIEGSYIIEEVHLKDASCHMKMNKKGEVNYRIVKRTEGKGPATVTFDLSSIHLDNVNFNYSSDRREVYLEIFADKTQCRLNVNEDVYDIRASGDFVFNKLFVQQKIWVSDKAIELEAKVVYNDPEKDIDFNSSKFRISDSDFVVYGNYRFSDTPLIDLNVEGQNTDIQTILSLLPNEAGERFKKYRSKGDVYFDLAMKGEVGRKGSPALDINFGLIDCDLIYPDNDVSLSQTRADGRFHTSRLSDPATYELTLKDVSGSLEGQHFGGKLFYKNFDDPFIKLDFEGDLNINSVFKFYQVDNVQEAKGDLSANVTFEGKLKDLRSKAGAARIKTSGDIDLRGVDLTMKELRLPLKELNGNLLFNNNDLALSDVSGRFGNSDFLLNGFFKNIIAYVLFEDEPVGIESTLESDFIDMDELLGAGEQEQAGGEYVFELSPRLRLRFNCNVRSLKFRRFTSRNISGNLKIKDKVALADKLDLESMGGTIHLSGLVDARNVKDIKVNTSFTLNKIDIDSIFYVFENFNQNFLEDRHLKGKIVAEVKAEMDFNENLRLFTETLTSNISTSIIGGELIDFEPMKRLDRYLDEDKLDHLRFSELKNDIYIENKTIYLPQMEVGSNVTNIKVSGTHTFDQKIDYRIIAPLRSHRKIDKDEAFGAIEENVTGQSRLYLKIVGTTSDYRVVYDKDGVKQKIVSDLRKEVNELKEAFRNKGLKKQQTIELEEDDYFDWHDDSR